MNKKVLKFYATWCEPCKMLSSYLEDVKTDVPIEEIDIDKDMQLAMKHHVRGVPTMIMFEGDEIVKRFSGLKTADQLEAWLNG